MARVVITVETIRNASQKGLLELAVPGNAIITPDAREMAARLRVSFTQAPRRIQRPWLGANWKMNLLPAQVSSYCKDYRRRFPEADVAIFPPAIYLAQAAAELAPFGISIGAQNCHEKESGAFTGEISPPMLKQIGASSVLVGHSERRIHFHEDDELIRRKLDAAQAAGLQTVLCLGEDLHQRNSGQAASRVKQQLRAALHNWQGRPERLIIAYEPVWAIGTGAAAQPADVEAMHRLIRQELQVLFPAADAAPIRIVYGGSVTAENAAPLASLPGVDGFLVGSASLSPKKFLDIIANTLSARQRGGQA